MPQTIGGILGSIAAMLLVAMFCSALTVQILSQPIVEQQLDQALYTLWENEMFLRVNQWLGIV